MVSQQFHTGYKVMIGVSLQSIRTVVRIATSLLVLLPAAWAIGANAEMPVWQRITIPVAKRPLDGNIDQCYEIEKAAWIWGEGVGLEEKLIVQFENTIEVAQRTEVILHVTADQRYELSLDGHLMSLGPDRSDVSHWAFASYRLELPAGSHTLSAVVAWVGEDAPCAQTTYRGGFLLAAEGPLSGKLNTGTGNWKARSVEGWSFKSGPPPDFVGREQTIDGRKRSSGRDLPLTTVAPPLNRNAFGLMRTGWRLHPSPLPDQFLEPLTIGTARAVAEGDRSEPIVIREPDCESPNRDSWQSLAQGEKEVVVPAESVVRVLWDLEDYRTAYPRMRITGGTGASVEIAWAESLYELDAEGKLGSFKGSRDQVLNKGFRGITDTFISGGTEENYRTWWWRAGRYVLLTVRTGLEPLTIKRFDLLQTRYPLEDEGEFVSSDANLNRTQNLMVRGMQACAHETYMDCPYYEQLMYVGDTRVELLTTYAMTRDTRLPKRAIELYDWSTSLWGMAAEHYPSRTPQLSPTFALIWVAMVRDFAFWRDDPEWVRARLPALRGTIDRFLVRLGKDDLLGPLPGWPFVDWVEEWPIGIPPAGKEGKSSIVNLHLVQALLNAAEVEQAFGEALIAERDRQWAQRIGARIVEHYWVPERKLLADDTDRKSFSEHAQCLAILSGILSDEQEASCLKAMLSDTDLSRCSIYFSFYLFETLARNGRGDQIHKRWNLWKDLDDAGLRTPIESGEPTRSDCHAWGSHPLFHARASLFGIRPASPGFATVVVEPHPGELEEMRVQLPHPKGEIAGHLHFEHATGTCTGTITLPDSIPGEFRWQGRMIRLSPGGTTSVSISK